MPIVPLPDFLSHISETHEFTAFFGGIMMSLALLFIFIAYSERKLQVGKDWMFVGYVLFVISLMLITTGVYCGAIIFALIGLYIIYAFIDGIRHIL